MLLQKFAVSEVFPCIPADSGQPLFWRFFFFIDKTLMIVFRNDSQNPGIHAISACRTTFELRRLFADRHSANCFDLHCGIASGSVISGKIGAKTGKLDFTVIGDTVNMAARIKSIDQDQYCFQIIY